MFFDASEQKQSNLNSFSILDEGTYGFQILEVTLKDTKAGNGKFIEVEFEVVGTNRKHWSRFNIENSNQTAIDIGRSAFADLAFAATKSVPKFKTETEMYRALMSKTVRTKIKHKKQKDNTMAAEPVSFWTVEGKHRSGVDFTEDKKVEKKVASDELPF